MIDQNTILYNRILAVGSCLVALSIFIVQIWLLLDSSAESIRLLFPDYPREPVYDGYLRGLAWADVLFAQPVWFLTGIGLWRMQHWAYITGAGVGFVSIYFTILQVSAQSYVGGAYNLFGVGVLQKWLGDNLLTDWLGLLPFSIFPVILGIFCVFKLLKHK